MLNRVLYLCFVLSMFSNEITSQCNEPLHLGLRLLVTQESVDTYWGGDQNDFETHFLTINLPTLQEAFDPVGVEFYVSSFSYYAGIVPSNVININDGNFPVIVHIGSSYSGVGFNSLSSLHVAAPSLNSNGDSFRHEMGHTFSLLHTFFSTTQNQPPELVVRPGDEEPNDLPANCDYTGDYICDTPGVPFYPNPCTTQSFDANGDSYYGAGCDNLMSYSQSTLNLIFTNGQYAQMRQTMLRSGLYYGYFNSNPPYDYYADFTYNFNQGCNQQLYTMVNFTNLSQHGGVFTYYWDFGDGIGFSTDENPSYTYTAIGNYDVTLLITSIDGLMCNQIIHAVSLSSANPVQIPYFNDFEGGDALDPFVIDTDISNDLPIDVKYYGENNHCLAFSGRPRIFEQGSNVQSFSFCADATDVCDLDLVFNYAKFRGLENPDPSDILKIEVNGNLIEEIELLENNQFIPFEINLDSYIGQIVNIRFSINFEEEISNQQKNFYFIDDLALKGEQDCDPCFSFEFECHPENYYCIQAVGGGNASQHCGCRVIWTGPGGTVYEGECIPWWSFPEGTVVNVHVFQCSGSDAVDVIFPVTIEYCPFDGGDGRRVGTINTNNESTLNNNRLTTDRLITVFPNPASGVINIKNPHVELVKFRVVNSFGQVIYAGTIAPTTTYQLDMKLTEGIYFIVWDNQLNKQHPQKIIALD